MFYIEPNFKMRDKIFSRVGVGANKDTGIPAMFGRETGDMTEERIAHILTEASHLMKTEDSHSNDDSRSPTHPQVQFDFSNVFSCKCTNICVNMTYSKFKVAL